MAGTNKRKGRPWGEIRPVNPAAGRLAAFLRAQVEGSGKTLAVLEKEISWSSTQISSLLGGRIPPQRFVTSLITATVPAPLRERRQSEADTLLYEALHPPRTPAPQVVAPRAAATTLDLAAVQAQQIETYDRLTRALEQQAELRQTADNSARLIWILLGMIHKLNDRVTTLSRERDQAAGREVLEAARAKLERARSQQAKAESELDRAEEKKRQAEALAARLQEQITALTDELDRLRGAGGASEEPLPHLAPYTQPAASADPEGDDIDAALARVTAVNDTDSDTVHRITTELGDPAPVIVPDNPTTSPDTPNKTAKELRTEAEAAMESGDFHEATRLYALLTTASTSFLGPTAPDTLFSRYQLAYCTGKTGDPTTARDLVAALIPDETDVLGPDHRDTLTSRHQHAYYTGEAGDPATARDLLAELIQDRERALGPDHRDTLTSRHQHAYCTGEAGDPTTARDLLAKLILDETDVLGPDHPDTLTSRHQHARYTAEAGDPTTARDLVAALISYETPILGPEHPDTLLSRYQHAYYTAEAGDPTTARDLLAKLIPDETRVLGADHPNTRISREQLIAWTEQADDPDTAPA
ncbi:tetratricopeptide repeat protein [Streptomyces sp. NBC_00091]|uniref:tetratricopeptide repeat protein n=1 Tax=Streptomyces sp. NBC_00091 TaxID=2975648 RepID=UPI00225685F7|nr:tetratricopeptide repeat protein [Streptomyces sp. NBC_00091]MCX5381125.1 tetratricopeptide repeat protein [Streptomyces sp. NBC_00091]